MCHRCATPWPSSFPRQRNLSSFRLCACLCNPLHGANTPGRDRATRRIGEAKDASEAAQVQASGPSDMCRRLRLPVHINGENSWELCSEFRELDPSDPGRRYRWASQGGGWGREGDVHHHPVAAMELDRHHPLTALSVSPWVSRQVPPVSGDIVFAPSLSPA